MAAAAGVPAAAGAAVAAAAVGGGGYDDEHSELLAACEEELRDVRLRERRVEGELKDAMDSLLRLEATGAEAVTDGKQMALHLEGVEKGLKPRLHGLQGSVAALAEHVYGCQELADKMSCTVRALDAKQMRVQRVLALVEDILNLRACAEGVERALEEGDLPDATSYVKQYRGIEGAAAKASEHYGAMVAAEARLKEEVLARVRRAVEGRDLEAVFKYCPLLGPLGLAGEGARVYEAFAEGLLRETLAPLAAEAEAEAGGRQPTPTRAVQLLPKIYNAAASFLNHHLPLVAHGFRAVAADASLIRLVQRECERAALPVLRRFVRERGLEEKCRWAAAATAAMDEGDGLVEGEEEEEGGVGEGGGNDPLAGMLPSGELDALMDEVALVIQHTESYDRFVRFCATEAQAAAAAYHGGSDAPASTAANAADATTTKPEPVLPAATELNAAVAEVSGPFVLLEAYLMRASVRKALAIDEAPPLPFPGGLPTAAGRGAGIGGGARTADDPLGLSRSGASAAGQTSSCVDDAYYVVRRCARRALVTGHAGTAAAIVNHVNSTLTDDLLAALLARVTEMRELPLPYTPTAAAASAAGGGSALGGGAGMVVAGVKQHWTKVKDSVLEAGLEGAQHLTAVAGSLGGALGVGGIAGLVTHYSEADVRQALDRLVALNNLAACARYTEKLRRELVAEVPSIFQDDPPTQQLMACLQDLAGTGQGFAQAQEEGVQHLAALVKPKARAFLVEALGDKPGTIPAVSYELDDAAFAANEASDPFAARFVEFLAALLGPLAQRLGGHSFELVQQSVADYVARRLEHHLLKSPHRRYTALGGLQFDKDLRCILTAFQPSSSAGGGPSGPGGAGGGRAGGVRGSFARLQQAARILTLDAPGDAVELYEFEGSMPHHHPSLPLPRGGSGGGASSSSSSRLAPEEAVGVLRLRVDFAPEEVERAGKALLQPGQSQ